MVQYKMIDYLLLVRSTFAMAPRQYPARSYQPRIFIEHLTLPWSSLPQLSTTYEYTQDTKKMNDVYAEFQIQAT